MTFKSTDWQERFEFRKAFGIRGIRSPPSTPSLECAGGYCVFLLRADYLNCCPPLSLSFLAVTRSIKQSIVEVRVLLWMCVYARVERHVFLAAACLRWKRPKDCHLEEEKEERDRR